MCCVCVVLNQNIQSAVYLFGLIVFVPEHKCDAALCSYAFIWKIGQFPWESPSLHLCVSVFLSLQLHLFLSVHFFMISHQQLSFSIFSNHSFFFSPFDTLLTYFLLSLSLSVSLSLLLSESVTHTHKCSLVHLHLLTHYLSTRTHTFTLAGSHNLHHSHCCRTVDPSLCLWLLLNPYY